MTRPLVLILSLFSLVMLKAPPAHAFGQRTASSRAGSILSPMGHEFITLLAAEGLRGQYPVLAAQDIAPVCFGGKDCYKTTSAVIFAAIIGERWVDFMGWAKLAGVAGSGDNSVRNSKCLDAVAQNAEEIQWDHFLRRRCEVGAAGRINAISGARARFIEYVKRAVNANEGNITVQDGAATAATFQVSLPYFLLGRALHLIQDSYSSEHAMRCEHDLTVVLDMNTFVCTEGVNRHSSTHPVNPWLPFLGSPSNGDNIWNSGAEGNWRDGDAVAVEGELKMLAQVAMQASRATWVAFLEARKGKGDAAALAAGVWDKWVQFDPTYTKHPHCEAANIFHYDPAAPNLRTDPDHAPVSGAARTRCQIDSDMSAELVNARRAQCLRQVGSGGYGTEQKDEITRESRFGLAGMGEPMNLANVKPPLQFDNDKVTRLEDPGQYAPDHCQAPPPEVSAATRSRAPLLRAKEQTLGFFVGAGHPRTALVAPRPQLKKPPPIHIVRKDASHQTLLAHASCPPGSLPTNGGLCFARTCAGDEVQVGTICKPDCRLNKHAPGCAKPPPPTGCARTAHRALSTACNHDPKTGYVYFWTENGNNDAGSYTIDCDNGYRDTTVGAPGNHDSPGWFYHGPDNQPKAQAVKKCRSSFVGLNQTTHAHSCVDGAGPWVPCDPGTGGGTTGGGGTVHDRVVGACTGEVAGGGRGRLEEYYRKAYAEQYSESWTRGLRAGHAPNHWGGILSVWCAISGGATSARWRTGQGVKGLGAIRTDLAGMKAGDILVTNGNGNYSNQVYAIVEQWNGSAAAVVGGEPVQRRSYARRQIAGFYSVGDQ